MRFLAMVAVVAFLTACDSDRSVPCGQAYDHLIEIAEQRPDEGLRGRFIAACIAAWDDGRHECLMRATTVEEALECRPTKVKPG